MRSVGKKITEGKRGEEFCPSVCNTPTGNKLGVNK
jgi:hypothetical protein